MKKPAITESEFFAKCETLTPTQKARIKAKIEAISLLDGLPMLDRYEVLKLYL